MAGSAPHQSPLGPLGAPARARRARRVGVGGARGSRRPPTPMRIPRRARGAHARGARRDPLHALPTVCAGGGGTPKPLRPDHERDEHAARGRGDGTVRGSRPRTWGAHDTASTLTRELAYFTTPSGAHIALARFSSRTASSFVSPAKAMHSAVSSRHLVVLLKWIADTPQSGCSRGFRHG